MSDIEIGDLEELIAGKGWQWLMAQRDKEWGSAAYAAKIEGIAATATDAVVQQFQINQVIVAKREVENFLNRPHAEIQRIREQLRHRPDEFAGARHRGGTL